MSDGKKRLLTGVKWTGASTAVTMAVQVVQIVVLAGILNPTDFGLMAMVMVVIGFAQIFGDMGINNAIIQRQDVTRSQLSTLYWLNVATGVLLAGAIVAITPLIAFAFHEPRLSDLVYGSSALFLIVPIGQQFQVLLQKQLRFPTLARIEICSSISGLTAALLTAYLGEGAYSLLWGKLAHAALKCLLLMAVGWREWRPGWGFRIGELKGYVRFGVFQLGERCVGYVNSRMDQFMIGNLFGAQTLGYYSMAFNLVMQSSALINSIATTIAFPHFSLIQNDNSRLRQGYLLLVNSLTKINAPAMIGSAVVAPLLIPLVFDEAWDGITAIFQGLAFVVLFRNLGTPLESLLLAKGRADWGFYGNLSLLAVSPLAIYLGSRYGVTGIVYAQIAMHVGYAFFDYFLFIKPLIGKCGTAYGSAIAKPMTFALLMGAIVFGFNEVLSLDRNVWRLAADIGIGLAAYGILLFAFDRPSFVGGSRRPVESIGK